MKKLLSILLGLALIFTTLFSGASFAIESKPVNKLPYVTITIGGEFKEEDKIVEKDRISQYVLEKFRIKLKYAFFAADNRDEKVKLLFSTGQEPEFTYMGATQQEFLRKAVSDDLIVNMGKYAAKNPKRWPLLNKYFKDKYVKVINNNIFGAPDRNYGVYCMYNFYNTSGAIAFNGKHLAKLNAKAPATIDEFINLLRKVKDRTDLNNDGKKVIPFTWRTDKGNWPQGELDSIFFTQYGTHVDGIWKDASGNFYNAATSEKTKEVWKLIQNMYKEGLIDKEIVTRDIWSFISDDIPKNKCFAWDINTPNARPGHQIWWMTQTIKQKDPDFKAGVDMVFNEKPLTGPAGIGKSYVDPFNAAYLNIISSRSKNVERILDLFNYAYSTDFAMLVNFGIKGLHYTLDKNWDFNTGKGINWKKDEFYKDAELWWKGATCWYGFASLNLLSSYTGYSVRMDACNSIEECYKGNQIWYYIMRTLDSGYKLNSKEDVAYATKIVESYHSPATMVIKPVSELLIKKSDTDVLVETKLMDIKKKYWNAFLIGQKDVEKEWPNFIKELDDAGMKAFYKVYTSKYLEAQDLYKTFK